MIQRLELQYYPGCANTEKVVNSNSRVILGWFKQAEVDADVVDELLQLWQMHRLKLADNDYPDKYLYVVFQGRSHLLTVENEQLDKQQCIKLAKHQYLQQMTRTLWRSLWKLILDEATNSLNPELQQGFIQNLQKTSFLSVNTRKSTHPHVTSALQPSTTLMITCDFSSIPYPDGILCSN